MTDTRKYIEEQFDKFFEFDTDDKSTVTSTSCKLFAEHLIADLLAVIELQRQALQSAVDCGMVPISSAKEGGAARHSQQVIIADKIRETLAITDDGVELVEVKVEDHLCAVITESGGYTKYNGPTVYTIKQKGGV